MKPVCDCGSCRKCRRREYMREYMREYDKSPERAEYKQAWADANREKVRASKRKWNRANKDKYRAWCEANKERKRAKERAWRKANPDKVRSYKKKHWEANKLRWREYNALRRMRIGGRVVDYRKVLDRDGYLCYLCNGLVAPDDVHFDHVIPLARGGEHTLNNIRVTHAHCNLVKAAS